MSTFSYAHNMVEYDTPFIVHTCNHSFLWFLCPCHTGRGVELRLMLFEVKVCTTNIHDLFPVFIFLLQTVGVELLTKTVNVPESSDVVVGTDWLILVFSN